MQMNFKMENFKEYERFQVLVNGIPQFTSNKDTINVTNGNFTDFESDVIPYGNNSIEFQV